MTPGQIPALTMALVGAVVDLIALFFPQLGLTDAQKAAVLAVSSTAIALGVALYSWYSHQTFLAGVRNQN